MMRFRLFAGVAAAALLSGCSTWRCRAFLDVRDITRDKPRGSYALKSIVFKGLDGMAREDAQKMYGRFLMLSEQDRFTYTTYLEDVAKACGCLSATGKGTPISVVLSPGEQCKTGWKTVGWPLCCTFGVMPAHFVDDVPVLVEVAFGDEPASAGIRSLLRVDAQYGLSRYDMDAPPPAVGACGEARDDGTIGSGSALRDERCRSVFVRLIAAAVERAVSEREGLSFRRAPQPSTEFGAVEFRGFSYPFSGATERRGVMAAETFAAPPVSDGEEGATPRVRKNPAAKTAEDVAAEPRQEKGAAPSGKKDQGADRVPVSVDERNLKAAFEAGLLTLSEYERERDALRKDRK